MKKKKKSFPFRWFGERKYEMFWICRSDMRTKVNIRSSYNAETMSIVFCDFASLCHFGDFSDSGSCFQDLVHKFTIQRFRMEHNAKCEDDATFHAVIFSYASLHVSFNAMHSYTIYTWRNYVFWRNGTCNFFWIFFYFPNKKNNKKYLCRNKFTKENPKRRVCSRACLEPLKSSVTALSLRCT